MTILRAAFQPVRLLFNGGDNMLGRSVQLTMPFQVEGGEEITDSAPAIYYLQLATGHPSTKAGTFELPEIRKMNSDGSYLWGEYLGTPIDPPPDIRFLNLENAVTDTIDNADIPVNKGINYHMDTRNLETAFKAYAYEPHTGEPGGDRAGGGEEDCIPYAVVFSNNHAMDFGRKAFEEETLPSLRGGKLPGRAAVVGAGTNLQDASRPVQFDLPQKGAKVELFAFATGCSGTPLDWSASGERSGLVLLPALTSPESVQRAFLIIEKAIRESEGGKGGEGKALRVVSIHWGPNWAYRNAKGDEEVDGQPFRRELARMLVDRLGVDCIYGHSSHHVRGMEVYKGKAILYGTGDFINDYEGFSNSGDEAFIRHSALFLLDVDPSSGNVCSVRLVPFFIDRLSLRRLRRETMQWDPQLASLVEAPDVDAFCAFLNRMSEKDAGKGGCPVVLKVKEKDKGVGGGPILCCDIATDKPSG
uniref:Capsule synthesis protein CapA domain-containing protein n=1 Tax=Chromera velia CCMP2878 TaxID=1169474 RepID=A0A0G4FH40_9ALVE|eukprot:Cvel_16976.t1-p1 / transcript=Cvel_16976.t1 / gene=Cvel_16976 / organism=Chromera_velia_CCMP2878 / gene_product=Uncharacterized protein Rv0574c/MT0602, putative / transcript_product=Uncharacterized protein Rv0574c/MT0602, putative / location=Cvel_scaffold1333:1348-4202(+) / protein_length=472 / sequence_SO=supercontig / SO=protein_coding / is_pseudo=false